MWGHARVLKLVKLDLNLYSMIIFEWEIMSSNLVFTRGLKIAQGILLAFLLHQQTVIPAFSHENKSHASFHSTFFDLFMRDVHVELHTHQFKGSRGHKKNSVVVSLWLTNQPIIFISIYHTSE